jgi:hypothetical protein
MKTVTAIESDLDHGLVSGGIAMPESLRNKNVCHFTNYPDDETSIHLLQLVGLHIHTLSDDDKLLIISTIEKILGVECLKYS